jgi:anti-anti-sigma factor
MQFPGGGLIDMRHQVPFVGERKLIRADDELAPVKRARGRVIDEVVGEKLAESSWEDVVPAGWNDKSLPPKSVRPDTNASISLPKPRVLLKPGGKALIPGDIAIQNASAKNAAGNSSIIANTATSGSSIDWVLINNGRCYRVNIRGCIDHSLREGWGRLISETEQSNVRDYEFNLAGAPALSLTGLGMLLLFRERKGAERDEIKLCNCNKDVEQLLRWAGMDTYFLIQSTHISV